MPDDLKIRYNISVFEKMQDFSLRNSHVFHAGGEDFSRHFRSSVWAIALIAWSAISAIFATRKRAVFGAFGIYIPENAFARFWGLLGPSTGISARNRHGFRHRKSRFFQKSSGALARACSGRKRPEIEVAVRHRGGGVAFTPPGFAFFEVKLDKNQGCLEAILDKSQSCFA